MVHLDTAQLIDYFAGRWTLDQERSIELHLAECDDCASRARDLYGKSHIFDQWSAARQREVQPATA